MAEFMQVRNGSANAQSVIRRKIGGRDLRSRPVDGHERDRTSHDLVIGAQVRQQIRVPARDEDQAADAMLQERGEVIDSEVAPGV